MAGCCEHGDEFSGSIKCGQLLISEELSVAKEGFFFIFSQNVAVCPKTFSNRVDSH
jgi:hypothetical protein